MCINDNDDYNDNDNNTHIYHSYHHNTHNTTLPLHYHYSTVKANDSSVNVVSNMVRSCLKQGVQSR